MENNQLTKINSFTRRNFSEDEIYIFDVILCDNEIDRDAERFSHNSLLSLQKLFIGKTGISDHNPKSENQLARIFDTQLITGNYIYVKDNSNMWDGVVNLSYKLYGNYPFIRGTNCVRITPAADRSEFLYSDNSLLRSGTRRSTKRFASHFHMADINSEYGQFELTDADVVSSKIIRHLYFDLDKQFLYSPQEALVYRDKYDKRAGLEYYCLYSGYNGEDLSDLVSFGSLQKRKISLVKIYGGSNGIFTELGVYVDDFNN